jgi:ATP-dependent DNA helicase RecG
MESALLNPLSTIPNVGPKRAEALKRLGLTTLWHLLFHVPARYEDLGHPTSISSLIVGHSATVKGTVVKVSERRPRGRSHVRSILTVKLADDTGELELVFFNQKYIQSSFTPDSEFYVFGKAEAKGRFIQMTSPDWELADEKQKHSPIRAVYPLTEGIMQKAIRGLVASALRYAATYVEETLPEAVYSQLKLPPLNKALMMVHAPYEFALEQNLPNRWRDYAELGRKRLAFEELLYLQLQVQKRRILLRQLPASTIDFPGEGSSLPWLPQSFVDGLPFKLTKAQERAISEIKDDLKEGLPMHRLLIGDVGSGKTVVLIYALLCAIAQGGQGALLAPTGVLAEQHFATVEKMLSHLPVSVTLLTGGTSKLEREGTLWDAGAGKTDLLIGTHAILEDDIEFQKLSLVVIDEQHKFGVRQRARLVGKGNHPHLLVTSATPIPRTLALTVYGDLDLTTLDEMPPGRMPIKSSWRFEDKLVEIYAEVKKRVNEGERVFMVCPIIEASEAMPDLAPLQDTYSQITENIFPDFRVGLLHGRMKSEEKSAVMADFAGGNLDILVSTTVIEVGVDVPEATMMVILSAERYGLSQLHQLRGRIGRGSKPSYCCAISGQRLSEQGKERLAAFASTTDGFILAEKDLEIRGPGEILGLKQSGALGFRAADLMRDTRLLEEARKCARRWLEKDPDMLLEESHHAKQLLDFFEAEAPLAGA